MGYRDDCLILEVFPDDLLHCSIGLDINTVQKLSIMLSLKGEIERMESILASKLIQYQDVARI